MLRPRLLRATLPRIRRRNIHALAPLLGGEFQEGIPEFLSPQAFNIAYHQYQSFMLYRLNKLVANTDYEHNDTKTLAVRFARDPQYAGAFNYASMAHNNHFFFNSLSSEETTIPKSFKDELEESFSSMETLRHEFAATADAMFGPGFIWLVYRNNDATFSSRSSRYALLTTYLAGSPYPEAHWRRQTTDQNTQNEHFNAQERLMNSAPANTVGHIGKHSTPAGLKQVPPGGFQRPDSIVPLLCLNTWEHVWLPDYGVAGKKEYAERWWKRINWAEVYSHVPTAELRTGIGR